MKKSFALKYLKLLSFLWAQLLVTVAFSSRIFAQYDVCDFLPCGVVPGYQSSATDSMTIVERLFYFGVSLIFVGLVAFGIFIIVKAAYKIVRSEGNEDQLQEGAKAIKTVFIGLAMLVAGIVGLLVMTYILGASDIFNANVESPDGIDLPIIN